MLTNKIQVAYPIGLKIKDVRMMTKEELDAEGWDESFHDFPVAIILEDGGKIYGSADPEGNGPGCLFGVTKDNESIIISPLTQEMINEGKTS